LLQTSVMMMTMLWNPIKITFNTSNGGFYSWTVSIFDRNICFDNEKSIWLLKMYFWDSKLVHLFS